PTMRRSSGSSHATASWMARSTSRRADSTSKALAARGWTFTSLREPGFHLKPDPRPTTWPELGRPGPEAPFQPDPGCKDAILTPRRARAERMDVDAGEELKGFGLSSYEASAYAILLRLGSADASLVAQKASIPFGRVYDVLNSLVDRGLLTLHEGRPKQYRAVQPRVAMSLLLAQRKRELDDRYAELTRLASDLEKR